MSIATSTELEVQLSEMNQTEKDKSCMISITTRSSGKINKSKQMNTTFRHAEQMAARKEGWRQAKLEEKSQIATVSYK